MHWQDYTLARLFGRNAKQVVLQFDAFPAQIHYISEPQARCRPEQDRPIPVALRILQEPRNFKRREWLAFRTIFIALAKRLHSRNRIRCDIAKLASQLEGAVKNPFDDGVAGGRRPPFPMEMVAENSSDLLAIQLRSKPLPWDQDAQENPARSGGIGPSFSPMQSQPCWKASRSTSPQPSGMSALHPKRLPQAQREPCEPALRSTPCDVPFQKLLPMQGQSSMLSCDRFPWCFERACAYQDRRKRNTNMDFLREDLCGGWPSITTIVITYHYVNEVPTCPIDAGWRIFQRHGTKALFVPTAVTI